MSDKIRLGLSACFFHPDPERTTFNGRRLVYMEESMFGWLQGYGALVYLVPSVISSGPVDFREYLRPLDGLVFSGGVDVAPQSYGEEPLKPEWAGDAWRDYYDIQLFKAARELGKPIFGICRGAQVINVACGGTLFQDISHQHPGSLVHRNAEIYEQNFHEMTIAEGTLLAELYPSQRTAKINSVHHQGIRKLGAGLVVEARSSTDQVIEAVRGNEGSYLAAVQWHPEFQDPEDKSLLDPGPMVEHFLEHCLKARLGR